jgi:hypothetical protein
LIGQAALLPGVQTNAQYCDPDGDFNAHVGLASEGDGGSVGHVAPLQAGEQKSPSMPWTCIACSSEPQPFFGSS